MTSSARPMRSVLYIPGSKPRALEKARGLPVDAIIFDLEDAVAADEKVNARATLAEELRKDGYGAKVKLVRINGLDSEWGADDARAFAGADIDGLLLPKVNSAKDVDVLSKLAPRMPIWSMMETCRGVLNAMVIADHPAMSGFIMGTNDLAKELGSRSRGALMTSLQTCLLAARAGGIPCVDGVYNAFKDDDGLAAECAEGLDMGFDGKTLIHPAQVAIANKVFAPSTEEVEHALRQIAAFEAAEASGQGVAVLDGRIVENLHVVTARATIAKAEAIAAMED
ncbi:MAG: CoA ester lyase [Paracoccaceae bacterium]|nr:CoA ester lyase [Paracoccaceae bacterium]